MLPTNRSVRSTGRFWKSLLFGELTQFGNALEHICPNDITREAIFAKKNFDVVQLLCKSGFGANSESSLHWGFNKVSFLILVAETIPACTLSRKSWLSIYGRPDIGVSFLCRKVQKGKFAITFSSKSESQAGIWAKRIQRRWKAVTVKYLVKNGKSVINRGEKRKECAGA